MRVKSWRVGLLSLLMMVIAIVYAQLTSTTLPPQQIALDPPAPTSTILVAAAASLQKSLQEITPLYLKANPSHTINYNFAASGALQQQIEQGAPIDVFISAADKQMTALQVKGLLVSATQQDLLTNQLVLIVPNQSSMSLTNFRQLIQPEVQRISIGEPRSVPVGQYATEFLKNLGILEQVKSKFVLGNNVRSVLTVVETGDVDAGIVYITDAKSSDRVTIVATADKKLHSPIQYPIAVLKSSKSLAGARQYVEFLQSKSAQAIFRKYGFGIAKPRS
ncbi:molybdate ABC transporter substrate-binding protein [Chamaesiphon sp.]|uniref:molybdate ABC transporter substrate-binding protein n=1 Tax=Chamaesiphon sp. TaxID=2814140 RepID=UPI0035930237